MQKLHLVGFTNDLRNLILSRQKGVGSGGFSVSIDDRLRNALEEIARLQEESRFGGGTDPDAVVEVAPEETAAPAHSDTEVKRRRKPGSSSLLTPKEIQAELRAGHTVQEVARMAGTEVSWVERFVSPILAERKGIVEAVQMGVISRARRGRSGANVGESIMAFFKERRIDVTPEELDEHWKALRRNGVWEVTFRYAVRGESREALFSFDVETRTVKALNPMASQIAWRPPEAPGAQGETPGSPAKVVVLPAPTPILTARATPTQRQSAPNARNDGGRQAPSPKRNVWGSQQEPPASKKTRFIGVGKADASAPTRDSQAVRGNRTRASPQGAGPSDDRPSFATSSSRARPRRLLSQGDEEWKSAVAKTRASRKAGASGRTPPPPPPPRPATPRPQKKRLPDDWLLDG